MHDRGDNYLDARRWQDETMIGTTVPNLHREGQAAANGWDAARATLDRLDPSRIFSSPLLDRLLP